MQPDILVPVHEQTDVAFARRAAMEAAARAGFGEEDAGTLGLIVTEAASNQIKHGGGGDLILRNLSRDGHPQLEMIALDSGKGMANVARCFTDGYTTAGSPGTGLGAISRLSRFHDVYSQESKGTVLMARVGPPGSRDRAIDIGAISIPYPGESECGDSWACHVSAARTRIVIADGLGHGIFAAQASSAAISGIGERNVQPTDFVEDAHLRLKATRGAAIAVADIDEKRRTVAFSGVGNIAGAVVSETAPRRQMISMNGTAGHALRGVRQFEYPLPADCLIVMHSDGLATHWSLDKYPGLLSRHPSVIAGVLFRDFRRVRDDATVVVLRPGGRQA